MKRESTLSLTIMVIVMAILALFAGYLLGNWIIQMVTGSPDNTEQVVQKEIIEEEIIEDNENNTDISNKDLSISEDYSNNQLQGDVYVVQVGAFQKYENALSLKEKLTSKGFQVIVTDTIPYKVQLGASNSRNKAEEVEDRVEALGYEAFITH